MVLLDYPVDPQPRGPNPAIRRALEGNLDAYAATCTEIAQVGTHLVDNPALPWDNAFIPAFDAVSLFSMIASRRPRNYVEIGSGNSTIFAREAIENHSAATQLVSIDPNPRTEIDALCDELIRAPLQSTDLGIFDRLESGDVVFIDGSHQAFPNSDVMVFFLEVMPSLAKGVVVGIHDIYLPDDYPPWAAATMPNEQYVLAAWLLGGGATRVVLPNYFVCHYTQLARGAVAELWPRIGNPAIHGGAFWLQI